MVPGSIRYAFGAVASVIQKSNPSSGHCFERSLLRMPCVTSLSLPVTPQDTLNRDLDNFVRSFGLRQEELILDNR